MMSQFSTLPNATPQGSQYSGSVSDDVTVPNPTPLTEALDSEVLEPPPEIDFHAMTKALATIAEGLNESADQAMIPTPPINTPDVGSPAPSAIYRYPYARGRGMSTIGDRLAKAVAERRRSYRSSDIVSNSGSICSSVPADDESDSVSDLLSEGGRNRHDIPIALGSPRVNPMGLISFTSHDLVDRPPVPFNSTEVIETASPMRVGTGSQHPDSAKSTATGVTEMSTWQEDVEGQLERALQSIENLAHDEHKLNPTKPMEYFYEALLKRVLGARKRKFRTSVDLIDESS